MTAVVCTFLDGNGRETPVGPAGTVAEAAAMFWTGRGYWPDAPMRVGVLEDGAVWCLECPGPTTVADEGLEEDYRDGCTYWARAFECGHGDGLPWCRSCRGYHALGGAHHERDDWGEPVSLR